MDRCDVESHRFQDLRRDLRAADVGELDLAGVGGDAPEDKLAVDLGISMAALRGLRLARQCVAVADRTAL